MPNPNLEQKQIYDPEQIVLEKNPQEILQKISQLEQENVLLKEEVNLLKEQLQKLLEPKEIKEKMEINNTTSFQEAIRAGNLNEAAAWLEKVKSDPKYDARWLDHRSCKIMGAFCNAGQLDEAEKYIDYAQSEEGRHDRKEKIEQLRVKAK